MRVRVLLLASRIKFCSVKVFSVGEGYCLILLLPEVSLSDPKAVEPSDVRHISDLFQ